jgi:endonuclease/exonuclease/phosphatase family metal-dependent hydrolase
VNSKKTVAEASIKVASYNLLKDTASAELAALIEDNDLDILCLQEVDSTGLPTKIGGLVLSDATRSNRLGLAIFYRESRFTAHETKSFALKKSLHDLVLSPAHERLIATRMTDNESGRDFVIASFHAAPLTATNMLRRNQINAAHEALRGLGETLPHLMVGDFNYPLFQGGLSKRLGKSGYDLTLSDRVTYTRYKVFRGHFDFATSAGMKIGSVRTLPRGKSDHLPIIVTANISE